MLKNENLTGFTRYGYRRNYEFPFILWPVQAEKTSKTISGLHREGVEKEAI